MNHRDAETQRKREKSQNLKISVSPCLCGLCVLFLLKNFEIMENQLGKLSPIAVTFFLFFIGVTLGITYWAARKTKSTADFYAAGGGISGF